MTRTLSIRNRQRVRAVETRLLRSLTRHLLAAEFGCSDFELCLHLVAAREMAALNSSFLQHDGSTDVITFDHVADGTHGAGERREAAGVTLSEQAADVAVGRMHGEIFVCLDDAVSQARQFRTTWQMELARYVIHGLLHLRGYDDRDPRLRRIMKREENRLLREVGRRFEIQALARKPRS